MRSLRAKATIIFLREPRAFKVRISNHFAKALSFWNLRKRHASWIMPRRTREHCRIGRASSPGFCFHFHRASP
jgi:hypothetical protein